MWMSNAIRRMKQGHDIPCPASPLRAHRTAVRACVLRSCMRGYHGVTWSAMTSCSTTYFGLNCELHSRSVFIPSSVHLYVFYFVFVTLFLFSMHCVVVLCSRWYLLVLMSLVVWFLPFVNDLMFVSSLYSSLFFNLFSSFIPFLLLSPRPAHSCYVLSACRTAPFACCWRGDYRLMFGAHALPG